MKTPIIRVTRDVHRTSIQFAQALNAASEIPSVRLQAFRVPWASLRAANREPEAPATTGTVFRTSLASNTSPQKLHVPSAGPVIAKLDVVHETTPQRLEIKISVREEAPRRLEESEHRFWGINE
jgi:hypothetical protein